MNGLLRFVELFQFIREFVLWELTAHRLIALMALEIFVYIGASLV
jgi:hypothetical protein